MFPSPQEQALLKSMRKELHSGVTPQQFGLESLHHDELRNQAESIGSSQTGAEMHAQALHAARFSKNIVSTLAHGIRQILRFAAPVR